MSRKSKAAMVCMYYTTTGSSTYIPQLQQLFVSSHLLVEQAASCKTPLVIKMNLKFKVLFLLPLVVCTGQPHEAQLPPYVGRLGSLMTDILLFIMYSGSMNYDAYFIAPALISLEETEFRDNGFLEFFAEDFKLADHAANFHFSETDSREEFAKRFFRYIADAENVPSKTREIAAEFTRHFEMRPWNIDTRGSIFPCPLYSFVRAITFLREQNQVEDMSNVEVILKFLLTQFNPSDYNIEYNASVVDIAATVGHGLSMDGRPLTLSDGTLASQRNKELFELLATKESVPQDVKDAIANVLPLM